MEQKINVLIPTWLSEWFEEFVTLTKGNKYERFTWNTPMLTRYKMTRAHLHRTCISIRYADDVTCPPAKRIELLYCIARDLLDPVSIIEP